MARDGHWIQKAVSKHPGKFRAKAEAAGMSTAAYAKKEEGAGGTLGKEANLAETLMGMHKRRKNTSGFGGKLFK